MVRKIAHLGVAVKDMEAAEKFYLENLGMGVTDREQLSNSKGAFIPVGDTMIELLQSTLPGSPIEKFIAKRGEGIHHIAYEVENIEQVLASLQAKGIELIDKVPKKGAHNSKIAFISPKGAYGVLIELVEPAKK
jgi:methylmalonyl-CoA epimerase